MIELMLTRIAMVIAMAGFMVGLRIVMRVRGLDERTRRNDVHVRHRAQDRRPVQLPRSDHNVDMAHVATVAERGAGQPSVVAAERR